MDEELAELGRQLVEDVRTYNEKLKAARQAVENRAGGQQCRRLAQVLWVGRLFERELRNLHGVELVEQAG